VEQISVLAERLVTLEPNVQQHAGRNAVTKFSACSAFETVSELGEGREGPGELEIIVCPRCLNRNQRRQVDLFVLESQVKQ